MPRRSIEAVTATDHPPTAVEYDRDASRTIRPVQSCWNIPPRPRNSKIPYCRDLRTRRPAGSAGNDLRACDLDWNVGQPGLAATRVEHSPKLRMNKRHADIAAPRPVR